MSELEAIEPLSQKEMMTCWRLDAANITIHIIGIKQGVPVYTRPEQNTRRLAGDLERKVMNTASQKGPLVCQIEEKLQKAFSPSQLDIINESHLHAGHQPGFNGEGESHIRIRMISQQLEGLSRVAIHRSINDLLAKEFADGLHALAIDAKAEK